MEDLKDVIGELQDIKRLLVAALLRSGMTQDGVAKALGANQSTVSRLLQPPKRRQKTVPTPRAD